jgi:hypothetical protein
MSETIFLLLKKKFSIANNYTVFFDARVHYRRAIDMNNLNIFHIQYCRHLKFRMLSVHNDSQINVKIKFKLVS